MYHQKLTNKQKEDLILKLTRKLQQIEFDPENSHPESRKQMEAYKKFMQLPLERKVTIRQQWTTYYEKVQESPIYMLVNEQREAARKGNWGRVKELADDARAMTKNGDLITIQKPTTIDPWEFDFGWVKDFFDTTRKIKELKDDLNSPDVDEQKEVWVG